MADAGEYDELVKAAAGSIIEDFNEMGTPLTPAQEERFRRFVAGLVDVEPPTQEEIWQTMEIALEAIRAKARERSLEAINMFMLEFISGVDLSSGAMQYLPLLTGAKEAVKAGAFDRAGELMMEFLGKCREAARSL